MEESLVESAEETTWYENDQPIQEFLESFRRQESLETDYQPDELSWINITKPPILK